MQTTNATTETKTTPAWESKFRDKWCENRDYEAGAILDLQITAVTNALTFYRCTQRALDATPSNAAQMDEHRKAAEHLRDAEESALQALYAIHKMRAEQDELTTKLEHYLAHLQSEGRA